MNDDDELKNVEGVANGKSDGIIIIKMNMQHFIAVNAQYSHQLLLSYEKNMGHDKMPIM